MIATQILIYIIYNTLCVSNVVEHRFIRKALHYLTGARVILTFSVRIETAAIVFKISLVCVYTAICAYNETLTYLNIEKMIRDMTRRTMEMLNP